MPNTEDDMSKPVTKRELHEALELWGGALEARLEARLEAKFDSKLQAMGDRIETWGRSMSAEIQNWGRQLSAELQQHTNRILEETRKMVAGVDDKYRDLPGRVDALEAKVLAPKRQRRR